jgi:hypothetical protein
VRVTLEHVFADDGALRRQLEERLGGRVLDAIVLEVDYVRETTLADVRYAQAPQAAMQEVGDVAVARS